MAREVAAATAATAKATAATYSWSIALQAARTVKVYPRRFNMVGFPFPDCADRHRSTKVNIIETHPKIYWPCTKYFCSEYRQEFQASMSSTSSGRRIQSSYGPPIERLPPLGVAMTAVSAVRAVTGRPWRNHTSLVAS